MTNKEKIVRCLGLSIGLAVFVLIGALDRGKCTEVPLHEPAWHEPRTRAVAAASLESLVRSSEERPTP